MEILYFSKAACVIPFRKKNDRTRGAAPSPEKADPRDPALQAGEEYGIIHLNAQEETTHVRQQETD